MKEQGKGEQQATACPNVCPKCELLCNRIGSHSTHRDGLGHTW